MRTFLITSGVMIRRASNKPELYWLCGVLPLLVLLLSPWNLISGRMVSLCALLPAVFLITGWHYSGSRTGLTTLLFRTDIEGGIKASEIALPAISGTLLSSAAAMAVGWPPAWQFFLTVPLTALSFTLLLSVTEERMKFPGRSILGLLWIWGISRPEGFQGTQEVLVVTDYPGRVLFASPESGGTHPDSFVLASLILALVSIGLFSLSRRK